MTGGQPDVPGDPATRQHNDQPYFVSTWVSHASFSCCACVAASSRDPDRSQTRLEQCSFYRSREKQCLKLLFDISTHSMQTVKAPGTHAPGGSEWQNSAYDHQSVHIFVLYRTLVANYKLLHNNVSNAASTHKQSQYNLH